MVETAENNDISALNILVHITEAGKTGTMQVIWPSIFRGIEQPDEFYPSKALRKLMEKFTAEHPQPFEELKELQYKYGVRSKAMDFLEAPLYGELDGLACEPPEAGRRKHSKEHLNDFVLSPISQIKLTSEQKLFELEQFLKRKNECRPLEKELTKNYRSWLARKCGSKIDHYVGGWGNLGESLTPEEAPYLRRNEVIPFIPFAGYDPGLGFNMAAHNKEAFLSTYESLTGVGWGEVSVLIAYGRLMSIRESMEEINATVDRLKLFEGEYFKGKLERKVFAQVVNELGK